MEAVGHVIYRVEGRDVIAGRAVEVEEKVGRVGEETRYWGGLTKIIDFAEIINGDE